LRKYDGEQELEWKDGSKSAFGLEPTPELYVQHTVEIMQEIKRVLRKDGVVFWNIGDSYWGGKGQSGSRGAEYQGVRHDKGDSLNTDYQTLGGQGLTRPQDARHNILKPKDMCLIPFRVAIALQEDGWWVRSVIIWSKPNPMPESVKDRPTNTHEYILMLTKSKKYYWDADAVRTQTQGNEHDKHSRVARKRFPTETINGIRREGYYPTANLRDVWTFPTQPFPGAHFAVFPEKLPELCIKAATSEKGCCPKCGAPWARAVEKTGHINTREPAHVPGNTPTKVDSTGWAPTMRATDKWQPTCNCGLDPIPCTVLDPFAGSGTALLVAQKLQRKAVGYELSKDYCKLDEARLRSYMPLWERVK